MTFALPSHTQKNLQAATPAAAGWRHEGEQRADTADDAATAPTRLPALPDANVQHNQQRKKEQTGEQERRALLSNQRQALLSSSMYQQHNEPAVRVRRAQQRKKRRPAPSSCGGGSSNSRSTHSLSPMDERILILYHSSLNQLRASETLQQQHTHELVYFQRKYGYEATFAATQIQKIFRGGAARTRLAAFGGPKQQRAARHVQFAFRWLVVCQRVFRRVQRKKNAKAVQIQKWYRGCKCRENLRDSHARLLIRRVILFQRHVRGHRFWRVVAALLHDHRCKAATVVQRCVRGWRGRQLAKAIRFEQHRYVRNLVKIIAVHQNSPWCEGCDIDCCTEDSLFDCFMARCVGLHDFNGAKALCLDGMKLFPSSARFSFFYAVLLQVLCEDIGTAMAFLNRALGVLHLSDDELTTYENQYLLPALQLRPNDAAVYLDLAVFCQCSGNITRAESHYAKALSLFPPDYTIPGYLHRVQMLDRLLFNYHRFCSIFNSRQTNVLAKVLPVTKRGEQIRFMVAKMNQYTAIYPADPENAYRVNAIYLSDDEVSAFLSGHGKTTTAQKPSSNGLVDKEVKVTPSQSLRSLASWRNSSQKISMRQKTMRNVTKETPADDSAAAPPRVKNIELIQLYQTEFRGLNVRATKLSGSSEKRSKLAISRDHAESLLKSLVFIDPAAAAAPGGERGHKLQELETSLPRLTPQAAPLPYIMVLPSLLKVHQQLRESVLLSYATVDIQRVFRGFQFRSQLRRENLIQSIQQRQVDHMLGQLQANFIVRECRRKSAVSIQRIFKGYAYRNHLRRWHIDATHIQRVFRGYRGRKRALAFQDGNCTFYMAEKVFQRGIEISGRRIMLSIEKVRAHCLEENCFLLCRISSHVYALLAFASLGQCGLSFRFDGFDFEDCITFPGFMSHESTLGLLCHLNWTYAETFVGKECVFQGMKLAIISVGFINRTTAETFMNCAAVKDKTGNGNDSRGRQNKVTAPLIDCIQSINLRELSTLGKDANTAELPLTVDDTARLVEAMIDRLALVHSIPMATKELKKKTPANFLITVTPPPRQHMLFICSAAHESGSLLRVVEENKRVSKQKRLSVNIYDQEQLKFPVIDGLRGVSIGQTHFRKKCARHAVQYTRCRCVLPITSTPAHIEALTLALTPVYIRSSESAESSGEANNNPEHRQSMGS